jgi:hypothetical protein
MRFLPEDMGILVSSGVLRQMGTILNTCVVLQVSGNMGTKASRLECHVKTLAKIVQIRRRRALTSKYFQYWYSGALMTSTSLMQSKQIVASAVSTFNESVVLRENVSVLSSELAAHRGAADSYTRQLAVTASLLQFGQVSMDLTSTSALANLISQSLPALLCVESAVLLLVVDQESTGMPGRSEKQFQRCLTEQTPGDTLPFISMNQIMQIPLYVDVASNSKPVRESMIPLSSANQDMFGVIFVVHHNSVKRSMNTADSSQYTGQGGSQAEEGMESWKGMESLLADSLSSCVYSCVSRASMADSVESIKESMVNMDAVTQENALLRSQLASLSQKFDLLAQ